MQIQAIDRTQMSMIVPYNLRNKAGEFQFIQQEHNGVLQCIRAFTLPHLVILQIPAFHLLVFSTGEQIWAPGAHYHATHRADVPSQGQFQFATSQVPDLQSKTLTLDFVGYCKENLKS